MTNLTLTNTPQQDNIQDLLNRYEIRKRELWRGENTNPYYVKGQFPTEIQDLVSKVKELKQLTLNG